MKKQLLVWIIIILATSCAHNLPDFTSRLSSRLPIEDKAEAIGEYSLGCLRGAQTFTGSEPGLLISQVKRGRYWGHPDLINLLTRAGLEFSKTNQSIILGDLSQSRGGPTITGHNSHQTGLDVDVWFKVLAKNDIPSFKTTETEDMKAVSEIGPNQIKLINFFAQDSSVERIFINPAFKKKLCEDTSPTKMSSEVQHKLRAWWGHDDHIHVRLKCPKDSPLCTTQKPIPEGTGCGEELNWWFTTEAKDGEKDLSWEEVKTTYLDKVKNLPAQCEFYKNF